ncbi:MAG: hypothetical protein HY855_08570 [Burkholderiales bacterium]|nr:hypothetical protein [Burkholderiales bacterium]
MAGQRQPGTVCAADGCSIDTGTLCRWDSPRPGPAGAALQGLLAGGAAPPEEGVQIVLTPLQLAAILERESIEQAGTVKQRLWGAVTVIGGALELVGAGALLLTPEPTTLSKVAGAALGAHGLDPAGTGLRQIVSGRPETSLTAGAARAAALSMGVSEQNAERIGLTVDIAIPMLLGLAGAARVLAVRRGAISLAAEEAAGGHTLARHVGRTEAQLRARLAAEPRIRAATSFHSLAEAERCVAEALRAHQAAIKAWARLAAPGERLPLAHDAGRVVGFGVLRGGHGVQQMSRLVVVLRKVQNNGRTYFVLTAYPKP